MLILRLTLANDQVSVNIDGKESHQFSLLNLSQSKEEWKDFLIDPSVYGAKLFNALFQDWAQTEFERLSKQIDRMIVLVLDSPELDGIAWEYAYNPVKKEYVVEDCAFMRALPADQRPANGRLKESYERVPLLFIPSNPLVDLDGVPMQELDEESEWEEMSKLITASCAGFDLMKMLPATLEQLQTVMERFSEGLVIHFSGHGDVKNGNAILLFERENGASKPLDAREFVRVIKDKSVIIFLSSCQSAVAEQTEYSNLARELVKGGVPFVLGMQFQIPDIFAPNISGQFYNYLAQGHSIPEAVRQARRAVKREIEFFIGMIALYAAHPNEEGKLAWHDSGVQTVRLFHAADVSDLPSLASGFIGRQRELLRIGTRLLEARKPLTVTLHGVGGIGKTALLWQALQRFAPSFELTLAIGLEPLPSLESVLGRLERFLDMPSPSANEIKKRETLVVKSLTGKRVLLGLDNFETLIYALHEKGDGEKVTAKSLQIFFNTLALNGVTLCVTSREVTNLPGETTEDIQGLTNESGGRLFQENVIKQKDQIYIEKTQQVSEMVGGHPLALRLLAAAFDDQVGTSLDQYIGELQSHLPKARDMWTEEDRHENLRASFDFTMHTMLQIKEGKDLQLALSRLSVFNGFFLPTVAAPVISNNWYQTEDEYNSQNKYAVNISNALWKRGLLERTKIALGEAQYLFRVHPVIKLFAKEYLSQVDIVKEIYSRSIRNLVRVAETEIVKDPAIAQAIFHAIPDLLDVAGSGNDESTARLQFKTGRLLMHFGLYDAALRLLARSQEILEKSNSRNEMIVAMHETAKILFARSDFYGAKRLLYRAAKEADNLGEIKSKSDILHSIAQIRVAQGNLDTAIILFQDVLSKKEEIGDLHGRSATIYSMAGVFRSRGDFNRAMDLYQESLEIFESLNDFQSISAALHEMAYIFEEQGKLDEALRLYERSLEIYKSLGYLQGFTITLHAMGKAYLTRGNSEEALKLFRQSLEIDEKFGYSHGRASTLAMIGQIYWMKTFYSEALLVLCDALRIFLQMGARPDAEKVALILLNSRDDIGIERFESLWLKEFGEPLPDWLAGSSVEKALEE